MVSIMVSNVYDVIGKVSEGLLAALEALARALELKF